MRARPPVLLAALLLAGCGGSSEQSSPEPPPPEPSPQREGPAPDAGAPAPVPPDGGVPEGHGADERGSVTIPAADSTPPQAELRVRLAGGRIVASVSPVRDGPAARVRIGEPRLRVTGLATDTDGGTGRIRISARWRDRCRPGEAPRIVTRYLPPPQIESIRIPPGRVVETQRRRSATIRLRDCPAQGEVWAEATNAHGLEAFSDPLRFFYRGGRPRLR